MNLDDMAQGLKALADPTRLKIMALLQTRPLCVCELVPQFAISQPAVSRHLHRLRDAGLVSETRRGQWVFYALNPDRLAALRDSLGNLPHLDEELTTVQAQRLLLSCDPPEEIPS